jgi:hypothetical protein
MKNYVFWLLAFFLIAPSFAGAEDFLGAPIGFQGKTIKKTDARLEMETGLSHDAVVAYYKKALSNEPDIKFREWKDATYIEDDGARAWHSITIDKGGQKGTTVVVMKDNWTWIIGTLVLRYIGVFVVLLILFLGMTVSGSIISRVVNKVEAKKAAS